MLVTLKSIQEHIIDPLGVIVNKVAQTAMAAVTWFLENNPWLAAAMYGLKRFLKRISGGLWKIIDGCAELVQAFVNVLLDNRVFQDLLLTFPDEMSVSNLIKYFTSSVVRGKWVELIVVFAQDLLEFFLSPSGKFWTIVSRVMKQTAAWIAGEFKRLMDTFPLFNLAMKAFTWVVDWIKDKIGGGANLFGGMKKDLDAAQKRNKRDLNLAGDKVQYLPVANVMQEQKPYHLGYDVHQGWPKGAGLMSDPPTTGIGEATCQVMNF